MTKEQRQRASGKLLLFGEHSAIYGYPAVGIALNRSLTVEVAPEVSWRFCFGDVEPCEEFDGEYASFFPHLEHVANNADLGNRCRDLRGRVRVTADLPIAVGFGSSAALCTAFARLLAPADADLSLLWRLAHRLESFFHGRASGIDTGLSVYTGARSFYFGDTELPTTHTVALPEATICYAALARTKSTRELVASVRQKQENDRETTGKHLDALGVIAENVASGDLRSAAELGEYATRAQHHLRELGVSSDSLETVLEAGLSAGAIGGKLSGAGGGGAFYFVCPDRATAYQVVEAVTREGGDDIAASPSVLEI